MMNNVKQLKTIFLELVLSNNLSYVKVKKNKAAHSYRHDFVGGGFFSYFGGLLKWFKNQRFEYARQKCNRKTVEVSKDDFSAVIL